MILITGFPYVRERFFATWRGYPEPDALQFLLPRRWTAKGGKVVFHPPADPRVRTTAAYFHDSHAPLIGGLLKGWMPVFPLHLWRMRRRVQLVYACSEPTLLSTLWFAVFSKLLGKKLVLFTWENIPYEKKFRGLSRLVHRSLLAVNCWLADGLVCGNPEGQLIHRQYTAKPMAIIPMNGVDPAFFSRSAVSANYQLPITNIPRDSVVYTFIGAIGYRKGIHLAVRALPEVLRAVPNAHLVIAGSGEYEEEIKRLTDEPFIREHVTRIPWLDDEGVHALLANSHVFLYPSIPTGGWAEQFGYSMAEASLMELPVISTRSGSIPHVVIDRQTGILVEPGEVRQLASAMIALGNDESLRERYGQAGRAYISDRFSHERVAREFSEFFSAVAT